VAVLSISNFEALIYCLRNLFAPEVVFEKTVFPEALNSKVSIPKLKYTFSWKLDNERDFQKFHRVLLPLNVCKTEFESGLKKTVRINKYLEE